MDTNEKQKPNTSFKDLHLYHVVHPVLWIKQQGADAFKEVLVTNSASLFAFRGLSYKGILHEETTPFWVRALDRKAQRVTALVTPS